MVRFFVNVGKNVNLTPKVVIEEVSNAVGISAKDIGKIDIFDNFMFMEVPTDVAPFVYEGLPHTRINGAKVNLEPAKPRPNKKK
ncbi:DbpA RNA binding domain-containing protein [Salsuginibacillus halophilus]